MLLALWRNVILCLYWSTGPQLSVSGLHGLAQIPLDLCQLWAPWKHNSWAEQVVLIHLKVSDWIINKWRSLDNVFLTNVLIIICLNRDGCVTAGVLFFFFNIINRHNFPAFHVLQYTFICRWYSIFDECFKEFDVMCSKSKDLSLGSHEGGIIYSLL